MRECVCAIVCVSRTSVVIRTERHLSGLHLLPNSETEGEEEIEEDELEHEHVSQHVLQGKGTSGKGGLSL